MCQSGAICLSADCWFNEHYKDPIRCVISGEASIFQFHSLCFDPTGARTHDVPRIGLGTLGTYFTSGILINT
jgi:hypothetical protein